MVKETLQEFEGYLSEARAKAGGGGGYGGVEVVSSDEVVSTVGGNNNNCSGVVDDVTSSLAHVALSADGIVSADVSGSEMKAEGVEDDDGEEEDNDDKEDDEGEDDEDEDEDDGELDYTPAEVRAVEACVALMQQTLACMKQSMQIATVVCDATHTHATSNTVDSVSASAGAGASSEELGLGLVAHSQRWVAQLASLAPALNKEVLDLGAELYPPFEAELAEGGCPAGGGGEGKVRCLFASLKAHCQDYLRLLTANTALQHLFTPEQLAKLHELSVNISACTLV